MPLLTAAEQDVSRKKESTMTFSWESLFDLVLAAIPIIESRKDKDHERATAALAALGDAYFATSKYYDSPITDTNRKGKPNWISLRNGTTQQISCAHLIPTYGVDLI